jgi:hypothetical protein
MEYPEASKTIHQYLRTKCVKWSKLEVSMFWTEKFFIIIQSIQLYSLIFAVNYPNWPIQWKKFYSYTYLSLTAGDLGTIIYSKSQSTSIFQVSYSFFWVFVTVILTFVLIILQSNTVFPRMARSVLLKYYTSIIDILYIPISFMTVPTIFCQYSSCAVSLSQIFISLLTFTGSGMYLLGYPMYLVYKIYKECLISHPKDHEDIIKSREIEYTLEINKTWLFDCYYLFSSYRRSMFRVYFRPLYLLMVLLITAVHTMFYENYPSKLGLLTSIILFLSTYITVFPVYRCYSSCFLQVLCYWTLFSNTLLGYLKVIKYNSLYLQDTNMSNLLLNINITFVLLLASLMLVFFTINLQWPTNLEDLNFLKKCYSFIVENLKNSYKMTLKLNSLDNYFLIRPSPITKLKELVYQDYILLKNENHLLQHTALDIIQLLSFYETKVASQSLLSSEKLEKNIGIVVSVIKRRWREQVLMNPVKRRLLLKILSLSLFLKNKFRFPFSPADDDNFEYKAPKKNLHDANDTVLTGINETQIAIDEKYLIESSRQLKEIKHALERRNVKKMIEISNSYINNGDMDVMEELRDAWDIIGRELIPLNLYEKLYADEIKIDLS